SRVEDLSPVVKKVSVELAPDRVKDALDTAYTSVSRTVKLKGYRQGHVPRRLVERYFGDDVKKDVAQKLVTGSIHEALAEHKLDPVAPPRVENGAVEAGQPFKYTATVEVRPKVEPKDYAVEELRGKEARFKVAVKGLKKREVPALDDAFVQDLGGEQKTMSDLRAKLRSEMETHKKERAEGEQREKLLEALVAKNPIEAPPALVERNVDAMLQGMLEGFMRRGLDPRQLGLNFDRMRDELRQRALLEVKGYLLLEAIAEKEKLEASEDDLNKHFDKMAGELKQPVEKVKAAFRRNDSLDSLKARLRQDKALAFLLGKANFT